MRRGEIRVLRDDPQRHEEPLAPPRKSLGWYNDVKKTFAELPED